MTYSIDGVSVTEIEIGNLKNIAAMCCSKTDKEKVKAVGNFHSKYRRRCPFWYEFCWVIYAFWSFWRVDDLIDNVRNILLDDNALKCILYYINGKTSIYLKSSMYTTSLVTVNNLDNCRVFLSKKSQFLKVIITKFACFAQYPVVGSGCWGFRLYFE